VNLRHCERSALSSVDCYDVFISFWGCVSIMQKITPNLWFNDQAEQAAAFYASPFQNGSIGRLLRYDKAAAKVSGQPEGSALTVEFAIEGGQFVGFNGGPAFKLNPSISFFVWCDSADEVDGLWNKLSDGGKALMPLDTYPFSKRYGWCQDRYGVSWQVIAMEEKMPQKIVPCLMFSDEQHGKAEEAIQTYTQIFPDGRIGHLERYRAGQGPEGKVVHGRFSLAGFDMTAMDSHVRHGFTFNEAVSFIVDCRDQEEVDYYWSKLAADGGMESMCGWLRDRYGVSWQVVPGRLMEMIISADKERAGRAMEAMLKMRKIVIADVEKAFDGK